MKITKLKKQIKIAQISQRNMYDTVEATLYLDDDGIYRVQGMAEKGLNVIIEYQHHEEQQQTQIDPGIPAYEEIIAVKRADDGLEIHNYDEEDLAQITSGDVSNAEDVYWEQKGDAYREGK